MALLQALQDLIRPQIEQMSRVPDNTVASVQVPTPTPVQAFIPEMPQQSTPDYQPQVPRVAGFPDIPAGGGRFVTEEDAKVWNSQTGTFEPKPEEPWYKRMAQDPAFFDRLALGFNTMRLTPDQQLASILGDRIKTASEVGRENKTAKQVAVALQNQGRFEEAALVEANPEMAKTVLTSMFASDRAKVFTFKSGAELNKERNTDVFDPKKPYKVSSTGEISEIGGGGVNITNAMGKGDVKWEESSSAAIAEEFKGYRDAGNAAANLVPEIQSLQALVELAPSGPLVGALAEKFAGFSTAGDAFMSVIKRIGPKMRVVGSGASSDRDVQLLLESLGSLKNSPIANKFIYQAFLDKAKIDQQRAIISRQALTGKISRQDAMAKIDELNGKSIISPQLQAIIENIGSGAPEGANSEAWSRMTPSERSKYQRMDPDQRARAEAEVLARPQN